jgi:penicillin-binding protein 2
MFGEDAIIRSHDKRAGQIAIFIILAFTMILSRLWYLQVYKGELLHEYSIKNRLREEIIWAPRGMMYGRNGGIIVDNRPRFDAILTRQYLRDKKETFKKLAAILDMDVESIEKIVRLNSYQAKYRPIIIKKNISRIEVARIETENDELPGISVQTFIKREYADGVIGAHLLGYISEISPSQLPRFKNRDRINYLLGDFIGQFGLEEKKDLIIRGQNGSEFVEVDALGRKKKYINTDNLFKGISDKDSVPGKNLKLTIDRDMQRAAFEALGDQAGSLVAIKVNTGEVLAMVSTPSFKPSEFSKGLTSEYWNQLIADKRNPLRDRTIQEHYSPGSTFKLVTAIAGLSEKIVSKNTEVICTGSIRLGRRPYHCWKKGGHGKVDMTKAIRESCNVYFQKIALKIDIDTLAKYATILGFGRKTGINLPREISGLIPTKEWKLKKNGEPWQKGETLSCSIGQSYVLTTTLQLALSYGAIANGGILYRPYVVSEVLNNNGDVLESFSPQVVSNLSLNPQKIDIVKEGLFQVMNHPKGTGWYRRGKGLLMAGKTGTSQVIRASADKVYQKCEEMPYEFRHHGVFAGFMPFDKPKIALAAIVEHGCHGSSAAAPIVSKVSEVYIKKYHPELHKKNIKVQEEVNKKYLIAHQQRMEKLKRRLEKIKEEDAVNNIEEDVIDDDANSSLE